MDYLKPYIGFLQKKAELKTPLRVVLDCSNGTTGMVLGELKVESLKLKVINQKPNGNFPAHGPNPMLSGALSQLRKEVRKQEADFGAAFDADGDRVFFVDDRGRKVPSDAVLSLISQAFDGPIAIDARAGYLANELIKAGGKKIIESRVGHAFFKKVMKNRNANFGGELSGHYYFPLASGRFFDSGIAAAIYFANEVSELKRFGGKLSDWLDSLPKYYRSGELNFVVRDKNEVMKEFGRKYSKLARKISRSDGLKMEFSDWWFIVRPSQTEDLLRLNLEAKDQKVFQKRLAELKSLL